jgi:hypothetical protein
MSREVVVYVPAAGHRATAGIARGSAIVGRPDARQEDVRIYYEGAVYEQSEMQTFADRAVYACGRMVGGYPTSAAMSVPREALVAVGTFDPMTSEIVLTGDQSAAAVAEWSKCPGCSLVWCATARTPSPESPRGGADTYRSARAST